MNYGGFILGCITVILILLIVCAFIYPNTIYDSSIILLTAISSIAWIIVYMSTRTLRCIQNDNPKELICKIGGNGRKYKIKGGINTNYYNTITGGIDSISEEKKQNIIQLINFIAEKSDKQPGDTNHETELNNLLLSMDKNLTICTSDKSQRDINEDTVLLNYINSNYINYNTFNKYIFTQQPQEYIYGMKDSENIELIGFTYIMKKHFIAYVLYNNNDDQPQWYMMDTLNANKSSQTDKIKKVEQKEIDKIRSIPIKENISSNTIVTYLYRYKTNTELKKGLPTVLKHFNNICYAAAPLQLLMATDLLDITLTKKTAWTNPEDTLEAVTNTTVSTPTPTKTATPAAPEETTTPVQNVTTSTPQTTKAPIQTSTPAITSTNTVTSKIGNINIEIIIGDIFNVKADAIVNPANIQLNNAGGLALQIQSRLYVDKKEAKYLKKITDNITENNKNNNRIFNTGDAIITKVIPENLEFKYVIHTPGPDFSKSPDFGAESYAGDMIEMGKEKLKDCMFNIMDQANKNEVVTDIVNNTFIKQPNQNPITSISIPMISSAIFAGDLDKEDLHKSIGKKYIEGIFEYLDAQPSKQNITKINFVIYGNNNKLTDFSKSCFNNFVQGFNEGINEYNNKTPATSTPVQQNKPQPPTPAKTLAPAETEEAPVQQPAQTPAQKEAQKVVQQAFNIAIQEVPQVQQTANNIVPQALNTATQNAAQKVVQQQDLNNIKKWTEIINSNTVIKTDLKTQLIKYLNDNIKKKDVLKNIIYNLYNKDTIQNNDNYDKKRKYDEDKNPNLDLYKYYYDICKKYKTFLNNIQKINSDEYKRLNDVKIDKITEDNNDKITEEDNIKTKYKNMLDTPIFKLINDYTDYMEIPFYNRMIENSNLDIKDKNKKDRYDIQNLLPPDSRTLIYIFKKHKIAEKLNNFKLVYKLIEWSSILDKTTLNSLNNNDEGDELAEEENNDNLDNYEQDIVTDGDTSNQSIYYIQRKPIRDLIKTKFITDINDKNKLQNIIRRKAMRLFITFKKKIETDEESINTVDNQIQNFINFVNNPYITYDEEDFGSGEPYISYGSSYSSDSIKKISKRYGTDTTSFDKFYKELLHSEIL